MKIDSQGHVPYFFSNTSSPWKTPSKVPNFHMVCELSLNSVDKIVEQDVIVKLAS